MNDAIRTVAKWLNEGTDAPIDRTALSAVLCEAAKLRAIAAAAQNLVAQKGRHNTEIAYKRLEEAVSKINGETN